MDALSSILVLFGVMALVVGAFFIGFISDPFNKCKILRAMKKRKFVVLLSGRGSGEVLSFIVDMPVSNAEIKIVISKDREPLSFVPAPEFVKIFKGVPFVVVDGEDCRPIPLETPFGGQEWVKYAQPEWIKRLVNPGKLDAILVNFYSLFKAKARQQFEKNTIANWLPYIQLVATLAVIIFLVLAWTSQVQTQTAISALGESITKIAEHVGAKLASGGIAQS